MKLLVTGGAGFIGSNFIHYWLKNHPSDEIINLDKLTYAGNLDNLVDIENNQNYHLIIGSITDPDIVENTVKESDLIVHFAAESHVDRSIADAGEFLKTNVIGTEMLLQAAKKHDKRFHHISTDEVFGALRLDEDRVFNEQSPYQPRNPYAALKAASDHLVRAYYYTHNLDVTISNCSNNFGPYQFPEKFIPLVITNILEGKKVPVYGDGQYIRDWLYVEDHCRAIDLILEKGKIGQTYCIGGMAKGISNLEVVKKIIELLDVDESVIEYVADRPGHDRRYDVDWSKAKKELGFEPQADFDEYLAKTVDWYKQNQQWWKAVKTGKYQKYYEHHYGNKEQ